MCKKSGRMNAYSFDTVNCPWLYPARNKTKERDRE
jgi:hypothetical protein